MSSLLISGQISQRKLDKKQALLLQCTFQFMFSFRAVGSDMAQGQLVLPQGCVLGSSDLGLLATAGVTSVLVHR